MLRLGLEVARDAGGAVVGSGMSGGRSVSISSISVLLSDGESVLVSFSRCAVSNDSCCRV
jgi:hypothetical protein